MISLFNKNGTVYEQASRKTIEKRVIYILKNLVNKSTALDLTIVSITQILTIVSNDYNQIVSEGDDSASVRQTIMSLVAILQYQLPSLVIHSYNKTLLGIQLNQI